MRRQLCIALILSLILIGAFVSAVDRVSAAPLTWYVDDDTCPGPGMGTIGDPFCSIQDAIDVAENGDIIDVAPGTYTENLTVPSLLLITIQGADSDTVIVDGGGTGRVLYVLPDADVIISGITLQNGSEVQGGGVYNFATLSMHDCKVLNNSASDSGGGIFNLNSGNLTITNCVIRGNHATDAGSSGGGLSIFGVAEITDSEITGNDADGNGGGILVNSGSSLTLTGSTVSYNNVFLDGGSGGGIENGGTLVVSASTIGNNQATGESSSGGGVANNGFATITDSSIIENEASLVGGGISHSVGTLGITGCIVQGNILNGASGTGGGLYLATETVLEQVEISGNSVLNSGGGIKAAPSSGEGVGMLNVTISGNSASEGAGITSTGAGQTSIVHATIYDNSITSGTGAGGLLSFNTVNIVNSIIAGNDNDQCASGIPINSVGYNLDSGNTCGFTGPGDLVNQDPQLGPLTDNGGSNQTHKPELISPAINAGRPTDVFPEDQRGFPRPVGVLPDIGAVEVQMPFSLFLPLIMR